MTTFGSVCSGIEAASVAFKPLGWRAAWLSEIEPFACSVLAHHYPDVMNLGDMTNLPTLVRHGIVDAPDVLCGGTPCQAFSIAGLRQSLADERGNLSLIFCELANAIDSRREQPCVILWENVPGVLSTHDNAFGCFLAGLAGEDDPLEPPGGRWANAGAVFGPARTVAWRTLDAQFFGLAQRRRRVFVVASARTGFDPCKVLLEFDGVRRDSAPSRTQREEVASTLMGRVANGGAGHGARSGHAKDGTLIAYGGNNTSGPIEVATALRAKGGSGHGDFESETFVFDPGNVTSATNRSNPQPGDPCHTLAAKGVPPVLAFDSRQDPINSEHVFGALGSSSPQAQAVAQHSSVRRLSPLECERLQGFPDGYTLVPHRGKPAADGPRYAAIGNSWAVPVARWIGQRIAEQL